ncbi:alpha-L-iduronidase isoform X2 [Anopheles funestus]|uniref:alpha-L-iduronidase isoform X2 n=1 Tax=Anopheles funestus TaxID=62324 RepID=UPI0020C5C340|nr:alpha-L-iduronidase isoform X2 [Anopheles funestus]
MTETMWMLSLLLMKTLLSCLLLRESHMVVVSCSSSVTTAKPNYRSVQLTREELAATVRRMKPFWTSTGLCPPEPQNASGAFWQSRDSLMNLELIASLPNRGISHVRIHWLLELLEVSNEREEFHYNFTKLDTLFDHLHNLRLYPGFEIMGTPNGSVQHYSSAFWVDLVQQLVRRYVDRYGLRYVKKWRFETWNEPDLRNYNLLNFTVNEYLSYVFAIREGLHIVAENINAMQNTSTKATLFPLYGPAGLFKSVEHHPFCWAVLKVCNSNTTHSCPFDVITFHRKGTGRWASEVLNGGRQLFEDMLKSFPHIGRLNIANDEADPIAGWSTARPFQADVRYAAMVFSIVTQHWSAITTGDAFGRRLLFLSHDNAFLSYYPYVFEQRTLFARFQMNLTNPPHVQFIVKPIFSVLGMLANLAPLSGPTQYLEGNVSYVVSVDRNLTYLCLIASRSNDSSPMWVQRSYFNVTIFNDMFPVVRSSFSMVRRASFLIEAVQDGRNDPFKLWQMQGKPPFPTTEQLAAMREIQLPSVLHGGSRNIEFGRISSMAISLNLRGPWIVSIRVCGEDHTTPGRVYNVRIREVFREEVLIHWQLSTEKHHKHRCIQTYEVWYKSAAVKVVATTNGLKQPGKRRWLHINMLKHTPFKFYQYASNSSFHAGNQNKEASGVIGYYKVRAVDLFGRRGSFSKIVYYDGRGGET